MGNDCFRRVVVACGKIGLGNTHYGAFNRLAEGVVRGIGLLAVDKIDVVSLFHRETAVGGNFARIVAFKRRRFVRAAASGKHCDTQRGNRRDKNAYNFSKGFTHI